MDDLSTWYEVLRSLLPQRYAMSLLWDRQVIVVVSPWTDEVVWIHEEELRGLTPETAVCRIRRRVSDAESRRPHLALF